MIRLSSIILAFLFALTFFDGVSSRRGWRRGGRGNINSGGIIVSGGGGNSGRRRPGKSGKFERKYII